MKNVMRLTAAGAMLLFAGFGCADEELVHEVQVTGNITIDGKPIPKGSISFLAVDRKTPAGGGVIKDGKYIAFVPPGEKIVMVQGNKLVGQEREFADKPDSAMRDVYERITPAGYNAQNVTPLTATIEDEPEQQVDFELKSDFKG